MHHFFVKKEAVQSDRIIFPSEEAHHLRDVLHLRKGDVCAVTDGEGNQYEVQLGCVRKDSVCGEITQRLSARLPRFQLCIAEAFAQKGRMDVIVEKAAELGISALIPLISERTEVRPSIQGFERQHKRWQRKLEQTVKQSHLVRLPKIEVPNTFAKILSAFSDYAAVLLFSPSLSAPSIREVVVQLAKELARRKEGKILILIGPEGGFSPSEVQQACRAGAIQVNLEGAILKTDTAFVAIVSLLKYFLVEELNQ